MANAYATASTGQQIQPRDRTPAEGAMDRVNQRIGTLNSQIEALAQRLDSALRPAVPTPVGKAGINEVKPSCSSLVDQLDSQAFGLDVASERLQSILERLEL